MASNEPLFSIVLPVYNGAATLERALSSVLGQTYEKRELIVVDGGSSDGTLDILQRYDEHLELWISEPDAGVYDAMNKGLEHAKGDWLYFLGADDVMVDVLDRLAPRFRQPRTVYYGDVYMESRNRVYDGRFPWHKLRFKNVCHQAVFYPRAVFEHYRYSLDYAISADHELNLRVWADPRFRQRYVRELICLFARGSSSHDLDDGFEAAREDLVQELFGERLARRHRLFELRGRVAALARSFRRRGGE